MTKLVTKLLLTLKVVKIDTIFQFKSLKHSVKTNLCMLPYNPVAYKSDELYFNETLFYSKILRKL